MAVVIETTLGDITVDLFFRERPRASQNFLKLCKLKYYNFNLFHTVSRGFIAQTGDPTGSRSGGESIFGVLEGPLKRFFVAEANPRIKHTIMGLVSFVGNEENMIGSQFFFTLGEELTYLDGKHCVFGQVTEGFDVLELINEAICDSDDRPYQDIRITHTVVLDDPLPDIERMVLPSRSPSPSAERLQGGRIAPDEEIDETKGKSMNEINEIIAEREAKARANILEMVGDLPDAEMAPPENVLFVCKLNPVTTDDDLEIIFSRFGKIKSCEVIKDHKTGDSLQYAFVEFDEQKSCEDAYFKMDNVLIDDRRIHVDFSQSVSKIKWMGKGRGVRHLEEKVNKKKNHVEDRRKRRNKSRSSSSSPERKNRGNNYSSNSLEKRVHKDRGYQRTSNFKSGNGNQGQEEQSSSYHFQSKKKYDKVKRRSRSTTPVNDKNRNKISERYDNGRNQSYSDLKSPEIIRNNEVKKRKSRINQRSSDEEQISKEGRKKSLDKRGSKSKREIKKKPRSSSSSVSPESRGRRKYKTKSKERYSPSPRRISKRKKRHSSRSVSSDRAEHRKKSYDRNLEKSGDRSEFSRKKTKNIKNSRSSSSSESDISAKGNNKYENCRNDKKLSSSQKSKSKKSKLRSSSSRSPSPRKSRKEKSRRSRSVSPRRRK